MIVGFPGETEADFAELLDFVEATKFERLGVFKYSEEEGTAAAHMTRGNVSEEEKERRWQEMMDMQSAISRKKNQDLIGTIQRVMIDGVDSDSERADRPNASPCAGSRRCRVYRRAGIDAGHSADAGDMIDVKITGALTMT